ncbi:MAG: glycosyltransferase family 39 protein [Zoogloeaceae bacterium]|nr:glycosyltransferase family 39 protein [Zoogloeaceae bacterium]
MAVRRLQRPVAGGASDTGLRDALIVAGLTVLALALRSARLDFQPLWWDEGYSVWFAHQPLAEMLRLTALDIHPPLYYALLGGWSQLFGLAPVALRLFSVVAGVVAIALIYVAGRALGGRRAGLLAAGLLAINPLHVFYSQEVRMYGLVVVWSILAVLAAARWLGIGRTDRASGGWLAVYVAAVTLALYTQYYTAFLAVGLALAGLLALWRRGAGRRALLIWLGAQAVALVLYLPWLLYAAPRLVPYVSQKIVADSDRPLGLIVYLARHLAAYAAGHLEGPLAGWWPLGVVPLLLAAAGFVLLARRWRATKSAPPAPWSPAHAIGFLLIVLATLLLLGWLVNLSFPFFPERGERLLLLGQPVFLLLLACILDQSGRVLRLASIGVLVALSAVSLAAFYTTPRYAEEDYRPLIGQVNQWGRPEDTVFAVFPWQVGYWWSYGAAGGPQPLLSPADDWGAAAQAALDGALASGRVWFPEHLSLGGLFEAPAEDYLSSRASLLANQWYSPSTRLTGWAAPDTTERLSATPVEFANGQSLARVDVGPPVVEAANDTLFMELAWQTPPAGPRAVTVRLVGADGRTWAQQDYTLARPADADVDRLALVVPSGLPPGQYEVRLGLLQEAGGAPVDVVGPAPRPSGSEAALATVAVQRPDAPLAAGTLPFEQPLDARLDDALDALGYSATAGPVAPGGDLTVSLFWRALAGLAQRDDLAIAVQLLDRDGTVAAAWEGPPVAWQATSGWQTGELVRSQSTLRLPATVPDGQYSLIAALFDPATGERLPVTGQGRGTTDHLDLGQVAVQGREHDMAAPRPQASVDASLARIGRLAGYDLAQRAVHPGEPLDITLYWNPTETTGERLTVFVHLVDEAGVIVGQSDGEPGGGRLPTSSWLPGETITDRRSLAVRPDAGAGPATLVVGLYDPATGVRVPWVDATGAVLGDQLPLTTIDIR